MHGGIQRGKVLRWPLNEDVQSPKRRRRTRRPVAPDSCIKCLSASIDDGPQGFVGYDLNGTERVRILLPAEDFNGEKSMWWAEQLHRYLAEHCGAIPKPELRVVP